MTRKKGAHDQPASGDFNVGRKVRELRKEKRYTLLDMVTKTGLQKSLLEEIEAGEVVPPVATLLKLAKALNVGMAYFFEEDIGTGRIALNRKADRIRLQKRPHHHHEGEVDYIYESLEMKKANKHMEPLLVEFLPMEVSRMVFMNHEGEEFIYVLEGTLEFRTDDRVEVLHPGDALYFESDINHSFRSLEDGPVKAIVVVSTR